MANYEEAYELLQLKEFSGKPYKFLHKNQTEESMTIGGIYRSANPNAIDWDFVDRVVAVCESNNISEVLSNDREQSKKDLKRASIMLFADEDIQNQVKSVFKNNYWDLLRLDEVQSNLIAKQMFLFGVVAGVRTSARLAQRTAQVADDGYIGDISLRGINNQNDILFYNKFRELELAYYDSIIDKDQSKEVYKSGWIARGEILNRFRGVNV